MLLRAGYVRGLAAASCSHIHGGGGDFLAWQVARAVNGGEPEAGGVWLFGSGVRLAGLTPVELAPLSPASFPLAQRWGDRDGADGWRSWLCR